MDTKADHPQNQIDYTQPTSIDQVSVDKKLPHTHTHRDRQTDREYHIASTNSLAEAINIHADGSRRSKAFMCGCLCVILRVCLHDN